MRGPGKESLRPRRGPAAPRAGRARSRDQPVRGGAGARRPRPPRTQHGAHRPARRGQDRAAEHVPLDGHAAAVGHRQDRGPARAVDPAAGGCGPAHGGAGAALPGTAHRTGSSTSCPCSRRSRCATPRPRRAARSPPSSASTCPAARGRADSGDLEIDLTELFSDAATVAADLSVGIALFIDEMQDVPAPDISALCAACHELSQNGGAAHRGRRRAAAPAVGAVGQQELLRAAVPLRPHRPAGARPRPTWPCSRRPSGRRSRSSRARWTRCTRRPTATRTSCRPTAR